MLGIDFRDTGILDTFITAAACPMGGTWWSRTMRNILFVSMVVFNFFLLPVANEATEYCMTESFEASCRNDEVVVMEAATFGRMRLGRCVTRNYGFIGCSTGVLQQLDNLCSGKHKCKFDVSEAVLVRTKPCPQDFSSYLEASYSCIKVSTLPAERCSTAKYLKLHHPTGYIASVVTEETGCGSQQNPWVITAQAGQKINITLFDFGISGSFNTSSNPGAITAGNSNKRTNYPVYCQQYARIEEKDVARSTIVCGGERREKNVYISVTNEVEVHVMNRRTMGPQHYFLLKYNVVGCPNIHTPPDTYSKREGQKLHVICNHTGETSHLSCDGRRWQGELKNCSQVPGVDMEEMVTGVGLPPIGISIVIIIGVALVVVVYVAVMIVCVMYIQRRRRRLRQAAEKVDSLQGDIQLVKPDGGPNDGAEECMPMLSKSLPMRSSIGCVTLGEYTDVQMRNMIQHSQGGATLHHDAPIAIESFDPGLMCPDAHASHPACECHALYPRIRQLHPARIREPIYEPAKKLTKVQCPIVPNGASCYFELDAKELGNAQAVGGGGGVGKLPGPDVVSLTSAQRKASGPGPGASNKTDRNNSESENEANRLKEQAL